MNIYGSYILNTWRNRPNELDIMYPFSLHTNTCYFHLSKRQYIWLWMQKLISIMVECKFEIFSIFKHIWQPKCIFMIKDNATIVLISFLPISDLSYAESTTIKNPTQVQKMEHEWLDTHSLTKSTFCLTFVPKYWC